MVNGEEIQTWLLGCGIRWRRDLKRGNDEETRVFSEPYDFWVWVTDFCKAETRTVVTAHNLGYDIRISRALEILPMLGWRLEWSNLDKNVSAMVWRSERGTIVFSDLYTWLPYPLSDIGKWVGLRKDSMPKHNDSMDSWNRYCERDTRIVQSAVSQLTDYIDKNDLGNWQPTGAGTAYAMWRHRFMPEKVLVHDDTDVLKLERKGMSTGRAEAWRHGKLRGETWHEVDMRSAYTWIAAECALPAKFKYKGGALTNAQFRELYKVYAILAEVRITTRVPCVPFDNGERTLWPCGTFVTTLWDTELLGALDCGAQMEILRFATYVRKPALQNWAEYILDRVNGDVDVPNEVTRRYLKHAGRALIGRLSLRIPMWEHYGRNVSGITGISYSVNAHTGLVSKYLHIGSDMFVQTERKEAADSLPQITGWIMAECRMRLWRAMNVAGLDNIAHVDTDCVLVNDAGLANMLAHYGPSFHMLWQVKGRWSYVDVYGPRNYRTGKERKISGVPRKAKERAPGHFTGELWLSLGNDLQSGRSGSVTIQQSEWNVKMTDPRRIDAPGAGGKTEAIWV